MPENNTGSVGGILAAFAVGAAVGAGLTLLYAPRSGKETRDLLAKRARELKERAEGTLDDAKEMLAGKKAEILAAVEAGKEALREERAKHARSA